ncbi:hypothetical protein P4E94_04310 [Pontiellaceae bacterium B12219]|nr:hypothetical protein [Pontiellaceae bacterium B12219]
MNRVQKILFSALITGALSTGAAPLEESLDKASLSQLEQRLAEIDADLEQLAHFGLRSGIGAIGYRSFRSKDANTKEWIEVDFGAAYPIDNVVMVPAIWRDQEKGFQADGFPVEFRVVAGMIGDTNGTVIAERHAADAVLPRIAPLVIPTPGTTASWIRIEATRLSPRAFDNWHAFQLAELLVFSGPKNVALRRTVKVSSSQPDRPGAWDKRFLVDGLTPYLMDSAEGIQSRAFVSEVGEQPTLTLDLENEYPINRIHLHATDEGATVPLAYPGDLGIPMHLQILGAVQPDFSDAALLLDYHRNTINDTGPIMIWNIPEKNCRYVRLIAQKTGDAANLSADKFRIGFSEIELFSNDRNVALGKKVQITQTSERQHRSPDALTDGNNLYGKILPIQDWLNQLARRHDLETERPLISEELNQRYTRQKINLIRMSWLTVLLIVGIVIIFLTERLYQLRQVARIKERFAADLHDELGANIHTIAMLSDIAQDAESQEEWKHIHQRIEELTDRTSTSIRHIVNMQEADNLYIGLVADMQRAAQRIGTNLEQDFIIEGESHLDHLKPRIRIDLFLFYKECLVNICRHSGATRLKTHLAADSKSLRLTIQDNGQGIEGIPPSLKRRARLLGAKISATAPSDGGTCITLTLKTGKRTRLSRHRPRSKQRTRKGRSHEA